MKKFKSVLLFYILISSVSVFAGSESSETFWIDVRTPEEYNRDHLPVATNIPHDKIVELISTVTDNKQAEIRVYCRSGRRAATAKEALEEAGFTNVINDKSLDAATQQLQVSVKKKAQL